MRVGRQAFEVAEFSTGFRTRAEAEAVGAAEEARTRRISTRNPDDPHPKHIIVPDRGTAGFIHEQFPGCPVPEPLGGSVLGASKGKPGRQRAHTSNSEKPAAYRRRKREEREVAAAMVNGRLADTLGLDQQSIADKLRTTAPEFLGATALDVPALSSTVYADIWAKEPLVHIDRTDVDEFIRHLGEMSQRTVEANEDSGLITPAVMDPQASEQTSRGLANVRAVWGIWFDFDGGQMTPEALADLFPRYRIAAFNTHSSTPKAPRWRAFIPTDMAMTRDIHALVLGDLVRVMENAGWFSAEQVTKGRKNARGIHGMDQSKFNAASMFYLPCRAAAGELLSRLCRVAAVATQGRGGDQPSHHRRTGSRGSPGSACCPASGAAAARYRAQPFHAGHAELADGRGAGQG